MKAIVKSSVLALTGHGQLRASRCLISIALSACCTGLIFFCAILGTNDNRVITYAKSSSDAAKSSLDVFGHQAHNLSYLMKHDLTPNFSYSRRLIKTEHFNGDRPTLSVVNKMLPITPQILDTYHPANVAITSLPPLTLRVPNSPKVGSCIFSFGMSTKIPRLKGSISQLEHWLSNTDCPLNVLVPPGDGDLHLQQTIRDLFINATITTTDLEFAKSYFSLIKPLYEARTPSTQWLVLMDDDTFVPSLPALTDHFTTTYKAEEEMLVSATSDDLDQIRTFGLIPFGGGGVFISVPLAERLLRPETWEACLAIPQSQGDGLLNDCLGQHSIVRPIIDHGLNQMDIGGSDEPVAGYMESGRRMLTVHHWKSWFYVDMAMVAKVAEATGDEGVLMRWMFEGNLVLSNGYSIVEYVGGVDGIDFEAVELTWAKIGEQRRYLHHVGPLREKLGKDKKRTYLIAEAEAVEDGVRQIYINRVEGKNDSSTEIDRVIELVWLF
jgi:hypothetical protein